MLFKSRDISRLKEFLNAGLKPLQSKFESFCGICNDVSAAEDILLESRALAGSVADKKAALVIPTYNEKDNIKPLISKIRQFLPRAHIVVVDDNSPDGTADMVSALAVKDSRIKLINRPGKLGLGTAYRQGFDFVLKNLDVDYVFEMDADLSHDPGYLPVFLKLADSYEVVIGSRFLKRVSIKNRAIWRNVISKTSKWLINILLGLNLTDMNSGFRCYNASLLKRLDLEGMTSVGYAFQLEIIYLIKTVDNPRIKEIPIVYYERTSGRSKMSASIFWEGVAVLLKLALGGKTLSNQARNQIVYEVKR